MEKPSRVPLDSKLGITEGISMALLHAPSDFEWSPPPGVRLARTARGRADLVLAFFVRRSLLERQIDSLAHLIAPAGSLWLAWPKRTSGIVTDLTDHAMRDAALPLGLIDNKVCAIDLTWTALRFVRRRPRR